MDDTLKAHYVQRQAYHRNSFVENHVYKMLQAILLKMKQCFVWKRQLWLPPAFFEKNINGREG